MRTWSAFLSLPLMLVAQGPSAGPVQGILLERDAQTATGEFSVRLDDHHVLRYRFDTQTYVERDHQAIDVARLRPGERVEVLSDDGSLPVLHYARGVYVQPSPDPPRPASSIQSRAPRIREDRPLPRSTLALAGVVFRLSPERVVLHTRESGDQAILLRRDTRYIEDGNVVEAGDLKPNMRVFVKAGKTLYDEVEAYQVIWGRILMPE